MSDLLPSTPSPSAYVELATVWSAAGRPAWEAGRVWPLGLSWPREPDQACWSFPNASLDPEALGDAPGLAPIRRGQLGVRYPQPPPEAMTRGDEVANRDATSAMLALALGLRLLRAPPEARRALAGLRWAASGQLVGGRVGEVRGLAAKAFALALAASEQGGAQRCYLLVPDLPACAAQYSAGALAALDGELNRSLGRGGLRRPGVRLVRGADAASGRATLDARFTREAAPDDGLELAVIGPPPEAARCEVVFVPVGTLDQALAALAALAGLAPEALAAGPLPQATAPALPAAALPAAALPAAALPAAALPAAAPPAVPRRGARLLTPLLAALLGAGSVAAWAALRSNDAPDPAATGLAATGPEATTATGTSAEPVTEPASGAAEPSLPAPPQTSAAPLSAEGSATETPTPSGSAQAQPSEDAWGAGGPDEGRSASGGPSAPAATPGSAAPDTSARASAAEGVSAPAIRCQGERCGEVAEAVAALGLGDLAWSVRGAALVCDDLYGTCGFRELAVSAGGTPCAIGEAWRQNAPDPRAALEGVLRACAEGLR